MTTHDSTTISRDNVTWHEVEWLQAREKQWTGIDFVTMKCFIIDPFHFGIEFVFRLNFLYRQNIYDSWLV